MSRLEKLDMTQKLDQKTYERRLAEEQRRLLHLRLNLGGEIGGNGAGPGLLIVFEGPDAAGKGGAIKQVVSHLDPRHYRVINYSAPTTVEKRHHYLWRFWREVPGLGGMCVFDRSWYGRVLVERIEEFATKDEWRRAYKSIVEFEQTMVEEGVILVKIWMHISDDEQLRRFQARAVDPLKTWKLTDEDWRNRDKNELYREAAEEMFRRTDHTDAPWHVIAAEQKRFGRIAVLETVNREIELGMKRHGFPVPHPSELDTVDD
jgi:AMP-polyphosphate phosphotransferase